MSETFTKVRYGLVGLLLLFCAAVQAQTISGNVKDANGEPVIGATIMEQGTQNGTVTDFDGNFTLKLQKGGNINVSYVGMKSQVIKTAGKSSVSVILEDDNTTLNDLVVVGYGTMKKSDLTGSISSVDTEQLNAKGATSVAANLQGAVAGVNITRSSGLAGGGFNIEVRGQSTMGKNNNPLFVVDGVICDDIDWLNPQDIEKIDILKDASSTAIYGSRATNGVVIVSTKTAKAQGGKAAKPTISYDGYIGFTKAVRMPEFMSGSQFSQFRFFRYLTPEGGQGAYGAQNDWTITQGNYKTAMLTQLSTDAEGRTYEDYTKSYIRGIIDNGRETDWKDLVMRSTASQQNHYIAVSGNSQDVNYHVGFGYQKEEGMYKNDDMQRFNLKGAVDAKISEYLSAGISFNGAFTDHNTINSNAITNAFRLNPLIQAYDADGNLIQYPGKTEALGTSGDQFTGQANPLFDFENSSYNTKTYQMLANAYVELRPGIKGLSMKTTFSPNFVRTREGEFDGSQTVARNFGDNRASYTGYDKFSWTWDNQVNYSLRTDEHSVNAMYLFSTSKFNQEKSLQEAFAVPEGTLWYNLGQAGSTTYTNQTAYTEWSMISHAFRLNYTYLDRYMITGTVRWDGSSRFADGNRWGAFPSVAAAWRITEEPWMKKSADWLSNLKLRVSFGVTGNNYTEGTNFPTAVSPTGGTYYYGFADGTGNAVYYPSGIVNKALSWEKTSEWNFGLDFGFLNNRINGSIDVYTKTSKDLLMSTQLPYEAGGAKVIENNGRVRNSGIELALNGTIIKTKDWTWTAGLTFAHNKNKVLEVNGGTKDDIANSRFIGESIFSIYNYEWAGVVSDRSISLTDEQFALYQNKGGQLDRGSILSRDYYYQVYGWGEGMPIINDLNTDGEIDPDNDKKILGHSDPKWTGSFNTSVTYKGWDFSISLYTKQGYKAYDALYAQQVGSYADRGMSAIAKDFYIPAGTLLGCEYDNEGNMLNPVYQTETHYGDYPFPTNMGTWGIGTIWSGTNGKSGANYSVSTSNMANLNKNGVPSQIVNGTFWKVQNISLGYTFPKTWLAKTPIRSLRLYFNVTNPFVWSTDKYKGYDPELCTAAMSSQGPSTVTYQFGASVKF